MMLRGEKFRGVEQGEKQDSILRAARELSKHWQSGLRRRGLDDGQTVAHDDLLQDGGGIDVCQCLDVQ